jgi:hypothetical protein
VRNVMIVAVIVAVICVPQSLRRRQRVRSV